MKESIRNQRTIKNFDERIKYRTFDIQRYQDQLKIAKDEDHKNLNKQLIIRGMADIEYVKLCRKIFMRENPEGVAP